MEKAIKKWWPVFVLPTLAAFIIGFIIPFIQGVYLALCQFTTIKDAAFVGCPNFIERLRDTTFTHAFWYNCAFVVVSTLAINVGGLAVALILTKAIRGTNAFRTVFFMPNLIGGIVLGYIWQILLNCALALLEKPAAAAGRHGGLLGPRDPHVLAADRLYDDHLHRRAAEHTRHADRGGGDRRRDPWQTFWKVKLPMLMPSITICLFLTLTNSFKLFDQNMALTGGQPAHQSELLAYNIYYTFYWPLRAAVERHRPGQGGHLLR